MKRLKRVSALLMAALMLLTMLAGCGQSAQGDGPALVVCVGDAPVTLDPIYAQEPEDQTLIVHLYENLMRVVSTSQGATVTEGMAKSVDVEENVDGTVTYTFRLRGAQWSDGQDIRAEDFVYAWQRLADPLSQSPYAALLSIVCGYEEARSSGDMSLLRVTAKNSSTLEVVLSGQYDWFLTQVCTSPATMPLRQDVVKSLKEAAEEKSGGESAYWWSDFSALVTNGPFEMGDETAESLTLLENPDYDGSVGPSSLTFRFASSAEEAQTLYEEKKVDAVWPLTQERMEELSFQEDWQAEPVLETYSVLFNGEILQDVELRKALSLTIDRSAIAQLAGPAAQAAEGLIPPGVPGVEADFRTEAGPLLSTDPEQYEEDCREAVAMLEQAGYDDARSLGQVQLLYVDEGSTGAVAQALCEMWSQHLNLRASPQAVTERELWSALRAGEYTLAFLPVSAVGNDAECFLMEWTSESVDNVIGYENTAFDTLMSIIASAEDGTARMGCLQDAEDLLLAIDCALAPLYTQGTAWELRSPYVGALRDPRGWFCFTAVEEAVT